MRVAVLSPSGELDGSTALATAVYAHSKAELQGDGN